MSAVLPDGDSPELIDFIKNCWRRDRAEWSTLEQLENHPWLSAGDRAAGRDELSRRKHELQQGAPIMKVSSAQAARRENGERSIEVTFTAGKTRQRKPKRHYH
jgi:hypothetical protein